MQSSIPEHILSAYFKGTATVLEEKQLHQWLKADKSNVDRFFQCLAHWERQHPQYTPDSEAALAQYQSFLLGEKSMEQVLHRPSIMQPARAHSRYRFRWLAACIALLVAGGLWALQDQLIYRTYATPYGITRRVQLSDNSLVFLNANSTLRVPRWLEKNSLREVWITGEAFFSVARTATKSRFVVHTSQADVEVLGTRFNVQDRRGKTAILLDEGKVKLIPTARPELKPVLMNPQELVVMHQTDTTLHKIKVRSEPYTAWRENKLVFEEAPLYQVARVIEDHYGVRIRISDHRIARRRLTGTLPNNDFDVVLESLSVSCKIQIVRSKDQIIFR
jgi:ferric-dicitrate binding protein FerR (iron transport regulator)